MSSLYDNPERTDRLLEQCLTLLMTERINGLQDHVLVELNDDAFTRQGGSFPGRLAELLEERSRGKFTVLAVDLAIVPQPFKRSVYFVRCPADTVALEPVVQPAPGMVLCEINPYTSRLIVGKAFNTPAQIQVALAQRAKAQTSEVQQGIEAQQRRVRVSELFNGYVSRLEFLVQRTDNQLAREKWLRMRSPHNQYQGRILFEDVIELCDLLGIDAEILVTRPPS